MKAYELDKAIASNTLGNAVMLYGESHFLIEHYRGGLGHVPADANLLTLYHDEYDFDAAKTHLSQPSLFGDSNILIIKSEKKIAKKELDTLVELCLKNPTNRLLYLYYGTDYKTSNKSFLRKKGADEIRFFHPRANDAVKILLKEAQKRSITIDYNSALYLYQSQNSDLSLAFNELGKLELIQKPITPKEIDSVVYGLAEVKIEQFLDELLNKRPYIHLLERLLESGEDEIRIVTALSGYITQLYLFKSFIKLHGIMDSKAVLGYKLPKQIEQTRAALAIKISNSAYKNGLKTLLEAEFTMKSSGAVEKKSLLFSTLLKFSAIL